MKKTILLLLQSICILSYSQTFNGTSGAIPDAGCKNFTTTVTGVGVLGTTNSLKDIVVNINHTFDADIDITLIAPNGTSIELSTDNGSSGDNYTNTYFNNSALTLITSGTAPFTGYFKPEGNLSLLNGINANGTWTLQICDDFSGDIGTLNSWAINFEPTAAGSKINDIPDAGCKNFTTTVTGVGVLGTTNSLKDVVINIKHTYVADLEITLIAPNGTRVELTTDNGGSGDNYTDTYFSTTATTSITNGSAPYTGNYLPEGNLTLFNGVNADGIWILEVCDDAIGDVGNLDSWNINFESTGNIPDAGCKNFTKTITGVGVLGTTNSLSTILVNITHPFDGDLDISLIAPNGTTVELSTDNGGGGDNYTNTSFSSTATTSITNGTAPFTGYFTPEGNLAVLNGINADGIWTLQVCDDFSGDVGTLDSWEINFVNTNSSNSIPDNSCKNFTTSVSGVGVLGTTKSLKDVIVNISHTYDTDLDITLIAPNGTRVELSTDNGSSGDNYTNTIFSQKATTPITSGVAPFTGTFSPEGNLATFNGINADGIWTLQVCDDASNDVGNLNSWSINFENTPVLANGEGSYGNIKDTACNFFTAKVSGIGVLGNTKIFKDLKLDIVHTYDSDLDITLIAPNGTNIEISTDNGSSSDNYTNTIFSPTATNSILTGTAPFTGTFLPEGNFNNLTGINADGVWTLKICDDSQGDNGFLNSWSISFDTPTNIENNLTNSIYNTLTYYPNPVENVLNINTNEIISNIAIFDNLGQEVINITPNSSISEINLSELNTGIYHAKILVNGEFKIISIVKK